MGMNAMDRNPSKELAQSTPNLLYMAPANSGLLKVSYVRKDALRMERTSRLRKMI